ncbi:Non-ribosomal peptide synthetase MassC [Balamuthia mandrillaris]
MRPLSSHHQYQEKEKEEERQKQRQQVGEIVIGGLGVATGYFNLPELTATKFLPDPFVATAGREPQRMYRTGDLGYWLPDGCLAFAGRADDQLKIRGNRIELGEIETQLNQHAGVAAACVCVQQTITLEATATSTTHGNEGEEKRLIACVVPQKSNHPREQQVSKEELLRYMKERLPEYMLPKHIFFAEHLPTNLNGKVDKNQVLSMWEENQEEEDLRTSCTPLPLDAGVETRCDQSSVGCMLRDLWQSCLHDTAGTIGMDANFFQMGGDSFACMALAAKANEKGLPLTPLLITEHPTLRAQLQYLLSLPAQVSTTGTTREDYLLQVRLMPAQQRLADIVLKSHDSVEYLVPATPSQRALLMMSLRQPSSGLMQLVASTVSSSSSSSSSGVVFDIHAFHRAWEITCASHPALRASFHWTGDMATVLQAVHNKVKLPRFPVFEVGSEEKLEERVQRYLAVDRKRGMDFKVAPLLRMAIFKRGNDSQGPRCTFVWTYHHVSLDGTSTSIVFQDFVSLYTTLVRSSPPSTSPSNDPKRLETQTSLIEETALISTSSLQGQQFSVEQETRAEQFWKERMAGAPTEPLIPLDCTSSAPPTAEQLVIHHPLRPELVIRLKQWCNRNAMTLATVTFGAWLLLGFVEDCLSGKRRKALGSLINFAGRPSESLSAAAPKAVSMLVNPLPVHLSVDEEDLLLRWLRQLRTAVVQAQEYELFSLAKALSFANKQTLGLVRHCFNWDGSPLEHRTVECFSTPSSSTAASCAFRVERIEERTGFGLAMNVADHGGSTLTVTMEWNNGMYRQQTIHKQLVRFEWLLEGVVAVDKDDDPSLRHLIENISAVSAQLPIRLPLGLTPSELAVLRYRRGPKRARVASYFEESMWKLQVVKVKGTLKPSALHRCLHELARRHPILRTVFYHCEDNEEELLRRTIPQEDIDVSFQAQDLSYLSKGQQAAKFEEARASAKQLLRLGQGDNQNMFGIIALRLGKLRHCLLLCYHELLLDQNSTMLFWQQLSLLLNGKDGNLRGKPKTDASSSSFFSIHQESGISAVLLLPLFNRTRLRGNYEKICNPQTSFSKPPLPAQLPYSVLPSSLSESEAAVTRRPTATVVRTLLVPNINGEEGAQRLLLQQPVVEEKQLLAALLILLHRYNTETECVAATLVPSELVPRGTDSHTAVVLGCFVAPRILAANIPSANCRAEDVIRQVERALLNSGADDDEDNCYDDQWQQHSCDSSSGIQHRHGNNVELLFHPYVEFPREECTPLRLSLLPSRSMTLLSGSTEVAFHISEDRPGGSPVGTLELALHYDTRLFSSRAAAFMTAHYANVLSSMLADPAVLLGDIPLLSAEENQLLDSFSTSNENHKMQDAAAAVLVQHLFEKNVASLPDRTAAYVAEGDISVSYDQLNYKAEAIKEMLWDVCGRQKRVVALFFRRSVGLLASQLAVLKAGFVVLTLDPEAPLQRNSGILEDANCQVILHMDELKDSLPSPTVNGSYDPRLVQLCIDCLGEPVVAESSGKGRHLCKPTAAAALHHDVAMLVFTSGTTGRPKGIQVTHQNMVSMFSNKFQFHVEEGDRVLATTAVQFDMSVLEGLGTLCGGGSVVLVDKESILDSRSMAKVIKQHKITKMVFVSALFNHHARERPEMFAGLKQIILGGDEVLPKPVLRVLETNPSLIITPGYGPTECTMVSTYYSMDPALLSSMQTSVPIGRPIDNAVAYVVDSYFNRVPVGVCGELLIGGGGVTKGYLGNEELTVRKFVPNPFASSAVGGATGGSAMAPVLYRTGDKVKWLSDGNILFVGRNDGQLKIRGNRVELGEIVRALQDHPLVGDVAVVACDGEGPAPTAEKHLVAFIVRKGKIATGSGITAPLEAAMQEDFRTFLRGRLPSYMTPRNFFSIDRIPMTLNQKVDAAKLRDIAHIKLREEMEENDIGLLHPHELGNGGEACKNSCVNGSKDRITSISGGCPEHHIAVRKKLHSLWKGVIGHPVRPEDRFFEVGGESLMVSRLCQQIANAFGLDEDEDLMGVFFERPTIAGMEKYLLQRFEAITATGETHQLLQPSNAGSMTQTISKMQPESTPTASFPPATHSANNKEGKEKKEKNQAMGNVESTHIAIVGMGFRGPKASNYQELWENLKNGQDCITRFTTAELKGHVSDEALSHPSYIKARGWVEDALQFDPQFFNIAEEEACAMSPQHWMFLEMAATALNDAGYPNPSLLRTERKLTGVFVGAADSHSDDSGYSNGEDEKEEEEEGTGTCRKNETKTKRRRTPAEETKRSMLRSNHFIASRVAYHLDLDGPAVSVQAACASALVAVHQACSALNNGECDIAVAGGVEAAHKEKEGYFVATTSLSKDGVCRPFDTQAGGCVPGNGCGAVVLRRLQDALADENHIYAVIRGSATKNDGAAGKMGYYCPGVQGVASTIEHAIRVAGLRPQDISFVETNGTAVPLSDSIEIQALRKVFVERAATKDGQTKYQMEPLHQHRSQYCDGEDSSRQHPHGPHIALGAIKSNIGHLGAASGIAALIKTVLCLYHDTIVPTVNHSSSHANLRLESSPFFVPTKCEAWPLTTVHSHLGKAAGDETRTLFAGVTAIGSGGTNVHVVLQNAHPFLPRRGGVSLSADSSLQERKLNIPPLCFNRVSMSSLLCKHQIAVKTLDISSISQEEEIAAFELYE